MTHQNRHLIELSDLLAFTLTCKSCGSSVSLPVSGIVAKAIKANRLGACPSCDEPWLTLPSGNTLTILFDDLRANFQLLSSAMSDRAKASGGFTLALEISSDPASDART